MADISVSKKVFKICLDSVMNIVNSIFIGIGLYDILFMVFKITLFIYPSVEFNDSVEVYVISPGIFIRVYKGIQKNNLKK